MLLFRFHKELAGERLVSRPRLKVLIGSPQVGAVVFALLDSGADRMILPEPLARALQLPKGKEVQTRGIGGVTKCYETLAGVTFIDVEGKEERLQDVPAYVVADINEVVIGRSKVFESFRIVLEQFADRIVLERVIK